MAVVYLHIGEPKTGTTSVQRTLARSRQRLRESGVLYPGTRVNHFDESLAAAGLRYGADSGDSDGWASLLEQTRAWQGRVVLSSEVLCWASPEGAASVVRQLTGAEVHVVHTVRAFDGLLPSAYQEDLKHGCQQTFPEWIRDVAARNGQSNFARVFWRSHDTAAILGRWSALVSPQRYHLVTVPRASGSVLDRVAEVIGIAGRDLLTPPAGRVNRSLSPEEAEALRLVNGRAWKRFDWANQRRVLKEFLADDVLGSRLLDEAITTTWTLPPEGAALAEQVSADVSAAIQASEAHLTGALEDLKVGAGDPQATAILGSVSQDGVIDALADALSTVLVRQTREIRDYENSRSWRATAPLRALSQAWRSMPRGVWVGAPRRR